MNTKKTRLLVFISLIVAGIAILLRVFPSPQPQIFGYCLTTTRSHVVLGDDLCRLDYLLLDGCRLDEERLVTAVDQDLVNLAAQNGVNFILMVGNEPVSWPEATMKNILNSPAKRAHFIECLVSELRIKGYSGINFDLQGLCSEDLGVSFLREAYQEFHQKGYEVLVTLRPLDPILLSSELPNLLDRAILLLFDEGPRGGSCFPGSVVEVLSATSLPLEKLVVALGTFGHSLDEQGQEQGTAMSLHQTLALAERTRADIQWSQETGGFSFRYGEAGKSRLAWFLDAPGAYNMARELLGYGLAGYAIWGIGSEDPSIWGVVECLREERIPDPGSLERIPYSGMMECSGKGDILRLVSPPIEGRRKIVLDDLGHIKDVIYVDYPRSLNVVRYGAPGYKQVLLTFDDGPDPRYTLRVLDILKEQGVKAAFFIMGKHGLLYPEVLERIYKEGHEIGNHTFNHRNPMEISPWMLRFEMETTQLVIRSVTGHSTMLYRPPYNKGLRYSSPTDLLPCVLTQELGYVMVDQSIDPLDWEAASPEDIVERVLSQVSHGQTILLHDGGGNRENTLRALPLIIEALRDNGFSFVTASTLLDRTRDDIMPPARSDDRFLLKYASTTMRAMRGFYSGLAWACVFTLAVGVLRLFFLIPFALRHSRRKPPIITDHPRVSVVIPAYNEEKVICESVSSVLNSDYPNFEIVVVDDGSTDDTGRIVLEAFADDDRVNLITQENSGKASALNAGVRASTGEIVLAMDGDTSLGRNALSLLAGYFRDPTVGAVSGNVKVRNRHGLLTLFQHIEYVTGFNLERRAFSELNCITVVPGAIGAWQRESILRVGGFKRDTLAEDADLTLTLLRQGKRVCFEQNAMGYTEVPSDLRGLLSQRFRWCYGTLQCLWKHRGALLNPQNKSLGFIALPHIWLFHYGFQTLSPIIDIFVIISLAVGNIRYPIFYYSIFLVLDLVASIYAFHLGGEDPRPLIWLFLQRTLYRFLMVYLVLKSLLYSIRGEPVGWDKLRRTG